ncbi:hypothetical protein HD597_009470 [Nonomuraea thailandensis]|uniref:Ig-like domain-containing protein n=1 Tax=Nonomuraea thailandensis TaxID=1188745 RepID=A0A9X2GR71_9ACTN|nr:DUF2332 domain-containing protein [Nonomuraea thailandensis]MCP2362450.1 hypothetical protein [Nonomuraea thailandensis]
MPDERDTTVEWYRRFATLEARGASPLYERLASGVASDHEVLRLLFELPPAKRQPNLLFAAVRYVTGTPSGYDDFRRSLLEHREAVVATMLARRTQTNEPARCAALYPLLAALPQPLALLEAGASAGLCLLPDRYAYTYDLPGGPAHDRASPGRPARVDEGHVTGAVDSPLRLRCQVEGVPPPHLAHPGPITVAWRSGIDLNPLDVDDPDDVRWLRTLIWPEQRERLHRLEAAMDLAREDPPPIVRGDLNDRLADVAAQAPPHATLVVYHTAVLYLMPGEGRAAFTQQLARLGCHWISQETESVLPQVTARLPRRPPTDAVMYVLALDGQPAAFSAMHGGRLRWL